jgi:hypothetical protein
MQEQQLAMGTNSEARNLSSGLKEKAKKKYFPSKQPKLPDP